MTDQVTDISSNKANGSVTVKSMKSSGFWDKVQITEWTFSLFLFAGSLSIVLGRLALDYGFFMQQQSHDKHTAQTIPVFSNASNIFTIPSMPEFNAEKLSVAGEKLLNACTRYEDVLASAVVTFTERYGWLIRAAVSGLAMTGFSWYIIYKDSRIPGIDPPSPFSPCKQRHKWAIKMQMNYLVGVLTGILIFMYMCLERM